MKKPNNELKKNMALTDGSGNVIELIESREERMKGLARTIGAYCRRIRDATDS